MRRKWVCEGKNEKKNKRPNQEHTRHIRNRPGALTKAGGSLQEENETTGGDKTRIQLRKKKGKVAADFF